MPWAIVIVTAALALGIWLAWTERRTTVSGPHTEDPAMPAWPAMTLPEIRLLAHLHQEAYGTVPDKLQACIDELQRAEEEPQ